MYKTTRVHKICEKCSQPAVAKNLCSRHYNQNRGGEADARPVVTERPTFEYLGNEEALFAMQESGKGEK